MGNMLLLVAASVTLTNATPANDPSYWITQNDYPTEALKLKQMGDVGFRLQIGSDGRVSSCAITKSSAVVALDQATCRLLSIRARFKKVRGQGSQSFESKFFWRMQP